jgi:hypothetical protein
MDLDANAILLGFLVSSIGIVCFVYGKRQSRFPHMLAGAALCVYPYFVSNLILSAVIAVAVLAALWVAVRVGA